jgi:hypothetical protein
MTPQIAAVPAPPLNSGAPLDTSVLTRDQSAALARESTDAATQQRYLDTLNTFVKIANGEKLNEGDLTACAATAATFAAVAAGMSPAAASGVGALFIVAMAVEAAVVIAFLWLAEKLGWTAKAGPGLCADMNQVPVDRFDPRWTPYHRLFGGRGWEPATDGHFETWIRPVLVYVFEAGNNCRDTSFFSADAFDQLVRMWNGSHDGPRRRINRKTSFYHGPGFDPDPQFLDPLQVFLAMFNRDYLEVQDGPLIVMFPSVAPDPQPQYVPLPHVNGIAGYPGWVRR